MSINKDIFDNHDLDIFDDDFEVIYEGDLPDIPMPEDDNFQDVLSNLSDQNLMIRKNGKVKCIIFKE